MKNVQVIDALCGQGKTEYAIRKINEAPISEHFVIITPYLEQHDRFIDGCPNRNFKSPNTQNAKKRKLQGVKDLVAKNENIVSTHSLFLDFDDELNELLTEGNYTLILDEVAQIVDNIQVKQRDIQRLITSGDIVFEGNRVIWIGDPNDNSRYADIRRYAQAGNLFQSRGQFFVWCFPPKVFNVFKRVQIMTYMFECQLQRYYFELYGIPYELHTLVNYELAPYNKRLDLRRAVMERLHIYEGDYNKVGSNTKNTLSKTWWENSMKDKDGHLTKRQQINKRECCTLNNIKTLRKNTRNYFLGLGASADDVFWTLPKEYATSAHPTNFKSRYVSLNMRATNDYRNCIACAYLYNRFAHPSTLSFFRDNGVVKDKEAFEAGLAVSDLIQFIFRGCIRNESGDMHVFIPSSRMRNLLRDWGNGHF